MATAAGSAAGADRQKPGLQTLLNIRDLNEVVYLLKKYHFTKARYHELGLSLGLYDDTLKEIEDNYKSNASRRLSETLGAWLRKADNVESKGDPSYYTLIAALRAIGENAVANGIDREKHPACVILANHQSDQSLQDSLPSLVVLLHKEGITEEILPAIGGTEAILTAVQDAVCLNHENLEKFAAILQLFPTTVSVGDAVMKDYSKGFTDGIVQATDGEEKLPSDDTYKVSRPPRNIDELLRSVGVVTYSDDDSPLSGHYKSYTSFNCKFLHDLISNPLITIKVKPLLFSLSGLPRSGKTAAFNSFITHHIYSNPFLPCKMKMRPVAAEDVAHYDLIAVPNSNADGDLLITEAPKEASSVIGILSAFKQLLSTEGRVPLLDPNDATLQLNVFDELNDHLQYMYRYIGASLLSELGDEGRALYADKLKNVYPEESALVNIWDIPSNSTVHDILSALQGHLTNNHLALFLDLERDLDELHKPPKVNDGDVNLMEWHPRIHYLLRTCRMSESIEDKENRRDVCTIFANYEKDFTPEELQAKISDLKEEVQSAAQHIGVSKLLDENIETVGRKGFPNLSKKIKEMIFKTPVENIPIAWLFLRGMFHLSSEVFIHKYKLKALAVECGMDDSSLKRFGKFYTSFGSIFDLSLVNPDSQYVIVKPIHFLKKVNNFLSSSSKHKKFPTMAYGIVPSIAAKEEFGEEWPAYIDSLVCLNLATEVASDSIEMPSNFPPLDPNDTYYFISSCRTGPSIKDIDTKSVHLITSINTPVAFNQVAYARLLLNAQPQRKLVACTNRNQTIIKDASSDTTVTLVSYGPATQLHLSKANYELCSDVVQAYHDMADNSPVIAKYKFVKFCVTGTITSPLDLSSAPSHTLPVDKVICEQCRVAGRFDDTLTKVWNKALKKESLFAKFDRKYLEKAFESGHVKAKISKAIVQGPARAGKTSLKCLIIDKPYESDKSTGCMESPCIAINKYAGSTSNGGTSWKLVTDDEMLAEAVYISKHYEDEEKRKNEQEQKDYIVAHDSRSETLTTTTTTTTDSGITSGNSATSAVSTVQQVSQSVKQEDSSEHISKKPVEQSTIRLPQNVARDIMNKAKDEMENMFDSVPSNSNKTVHKEWLYFIDSGGQIQFQRLLHAFLPCASVLLLVTNLAEGFSDQSSTEVQLENGAHSVSEYSPTNEELLEQLIIMVDACSEQQRRIVARDSYLSEIITPPNKLYVMAIATHLDKFEELCQKGQMSETIEEKHEKFRQIFRSLKDTLKCPNYHNSKIFYTIDGRKAMNDGGTQDSVVQKICEELRSQAFEIDIPLRWYAFEILLRKTAESFYGILTLDVCKAIGINELNMKSDEVESALKFFHLLNTMLYYPESKAPDLIFAHPQHLFDIITELAILIVKIRNKESVGEGVVSTTEFAHMGIISKEFIAISKTSKKILVTYKIHDFGSKLLLLFEYLMIAKTVPAAEYGEGRFFMPVLLPLIKHPEKSQSADSSFVFRFKNIAPLGFFCTFVIYLLSNHNEGKKPDWSIPSLHTKVKKLSSNYIVLQCRKLDNCDVYFLEHRDRYEVYCDEVEHRIALREELTKSMNNLVELEDKNFERPEPALYCPCSQSDVLHTATIETKVAPLLCKGDYSKGVKYRECVNGSHPCWSWLTTSQKEMTSFSKVSLQSHLNKEPVHVDLMNCLSSIDNKWKELGIALQLETSDLESAKKESSNRLSLSCVFECWKKNSSPPYTWATILDIISGPIINNGRLHNEIEQFLGTDQDSSLQADTQSDISYSEYSEENRRSKKRRSSSEFINQSSQKHSCMSRSSHKRQRRDSSSSSGTTSSHSTTRKRKLNLSLERDSRQSKSSKKHHQNTDTSLCSPQSKVGHSGSTAVGAIGHSRYHDDQDMDCAHSSRRHRTSSHSCRHESRSRHRSRSPVRREKTYHSRRHSRSGKHYKSPSRS